MIHILPFDIETRSPVDVGDVGAHIYATHPKTEVLCIGYASDDNEMKVWHPPEPPPREFITAAKNANWRGITHNVAFDHAILTYKLAPLYGFPIIPIERMICTMAMAHAMALPGKLERLAKVCNFEHQKDTAGARLMLKMARPRRPRKGEDKNAVHYFEDTERLGELDSYVSTDAAAAREAYQRFPELTETERQIWLLDQRINNRGFYLDQKLARAANKIAAAARPRINAELAEITGGEVTAYTQVGRLLQWIKACGVDIKTLGKKAIEALLEQELEEDVRRALELRLLGAQAAAAKADALLQRCSPDGRVRGSFVYHAAGPGRWSSRGAQVHNLKRPLTEDLEHAIKIIGTGDFDLACKEFDNPLAVIGDCIRGMIIASPGHTLIGGDFSGIEARVTAWIAGELGKLDVFRAYDAGLGPDPYIIAAGIIFNIDPVKLAADYKAGKPEAREMRQVGKGAELAFGFQGGVNAYKRFVPTNSAPVTDSEIQHRKEHGDSRGWSDAISADMLNGFTDVQIDRIKNAWRRAHPNIVRFWENINSAAWMSARNPGGIVSLGNNLQLTSNDSPFIQLTLPSGRDIAYPQARRTRAYNIKGKIVEHSEGFPCLLFKDAANGQWKDVKVYGGLLTENIVQGIARDLLAEAMLRIDKAGFSIVTHVHDECVIEVPIGQAERIKPVFTALMSQLPEWAEGLPVKVNAWVNNRYTK